MSGFEERIGECTVEVDIVDGSPVITLRDGDAVVFSHQEWLLIRVAVSRGLRSVWRADCCDTCKEPISDAIFYTQMNPPGGYDFPQVLVCDDCLAKPEWDEWRKEHGKS